MQEEEDMLPPFWLQTTDTPRIRRPRLRSLSLFLNSGLLLVLLLVIALFFIFVAIPSFLSFTSQIFRPHLVKKRWDSVNLVLVLFAIACGFLSRNTNNNNENTSSYEDPSISNASQEDNKSNPPTPHRWYDYADRTAGHNYNALNRLRSSSSYPDLRQESAWVTADERRRFYDDTHVSNYRFPGSDQIHSRQPRREPQEEEEEENSELKTTAVDTNFVVRTEEVSSNSPPPPLPQAPRPPSPPPSHTPPKLVKRRPKRTSYKALGEHHHEKIENLGKNYSEEAKNLQPPPSPPPPLFQLAEQTSTGGKNEKKRSSGGSSGTKDFLSSLRRRKKKQRQKSVENYDTILDPQPASSLPLYPSPSPPPTPPPPPPPLSSVFHNLFSSKKGKTKKVQSVASPAPPPPPALAKTAPAASTTKSGSGLITASEPDPLPVRTSSFNGGNENLSSGNESPLVPIPPSPPFKMADWKFVVHGDFVRINCNTSSSSGSPDLDDDGEGGSPSGAVGTDNQDSTTMPVFCPSPDVNTKADSFIARFRAGLKLEKMNSISERQGRGRSNLRPEQSPNAETVQGSPS